MSRGVSSAGREQIAARSACSSVKLGRLRRVTHCTLLATQAHPSQRVGLGRVLRYTVDVGAVRSSDSRHAMPRRRDDDEDDWDDEYLPDGVYDEDEDDGEPTVPCPYCKHEVLEAAQY